MLKTTLNGLELAYERQGRGTPLVLIHGYPLDHTIWNPVVPLLEAGFDLILPDLRGFGQSGAVRTRYLLTDMAADLAALLDFLKIKTAVIAGHSMGGYVALAFARCYPSRLRGLGLVASQAIADPPDRKAVRYQMADRVEANGVGEVAESMPALLTADADLQAALKQLILRQPPEGVAGALRAMADRPDSTDILPTFDFQVAIIHGLADKIIPSFGGEYPRSDG
ncbi:MAG: alpha/beta fold hydrolase [Chloroflexi bacterium]|nr:alpha/beta fold hydrolase [Chloroflexota bacterium]